MTMQDHIGANAYAANGGDAARICRELVEAKGAK